MTVSQILGFWCILGASVAHGALVQIPVQVSPFGGSQTLPITDNVGGTIRVGIRRICSRDVPASICQTSSTITGGFNVEFLLSNTQSLVNLSVGDEISSSSVSGSWGTANSLNRFEIPVKYEFFDDGRVEVFRGEYFIGFRVETAEGTHRYGWLEVANSGTGPSSVRSATFSDVADSPIVLQAIPEPSVILLVIGALGMLGRRRR